MLFIGICGASGSGKTTLAEGLKESLGDLCLVLPQDVYYRDHAQLSFEERVHINYDEPAVFDHDLLLEDVRSLSDGRPITRKGYDYTRHCRADSDELLQAPEVLVLEGIHTFYDPRLTDMMFLKIYIQVEPDICLLRRIERDIKERGRDIDGISEQYRTTVKPMYDLYVKNYAKDADMIVCGGGKNARIVEILTGYIQDHLQRRR